METEARTLRSAPAPDGYSPLRWRIMTWLRPRTQEFWLHYPGRSPAGIQVLKACNRSGYDFAVLWWHACSPCQLGHLARIRVTPEWQRQGYATRMMTWAMRDHDGYEWTTTIQSEDTRAFLPSLRSLVGVRFVDNNDHPRRCEHMEMSTARSYTPMLINPNTAVP